MPLLDEGKRCGPWTVVGPLGEGGNGEVFEVVHEDGTTRAALKIIKDHRAHTVSYGRFRREIETLRGLGEHRGVLPILDANLPESPTKRDRPWYVMPLARPLSAELEGKGVAVVVSAIAALADVIAGLHAEGIGHRDIKPENLYWYEEGPAIGDFGLVDVPGAESLTEPGRVAGAFGYMADEMMQYPDDAEAAPLDVYALAKLLWKLLTPGAVYPAQGALRADGGLSTLARTLTVPRADSLDRILERATRSVEARISMAEFAQELRGWLASPEPGGLPPATAEIIAAARATMAGTFEERDTAAAVQRDAALAGEHLVAAATAIVETVRSLDPQGAVIGARAVGRLSGLIEQPAETGTPVYGTPFHYGVRIARETGFGDPDVFITAFVVQATSDGQGVVTGMLYEGDERSNAATFVALPTRRSAVGIGLEAAIDETVADAAAQLPAVMEAFAKRASPG